MRKHLVGKKCYPAPRSRRAPGSLEGPKDLHKALLPLFPDSFVTLVTPETHKSFILQDQGRIKVRAAAGGRTCCPACCWLPLCALGRVA